MHGDINPPCMSTNMCSKCRYHNGRDSCMLVQAYYELSENEDEVNEYVKFKLFSALRNLFDVASEDIIGKGKMSFCRRGYTIETPDKIYEVSLNIDERDRV